MKNFREQFTECKDNGNCEIKKLEKPEVVYPVGYPVFRKSIILFTTYWCKRFNYQCTSETCKSFRESITLN
jgi:hypothetical protein